MVHNNKFHTQPRSINANKKEKNLRIVFDKNSLMFKTKNGVSLSHPVSQAIQKSKILAGTPKRDVPFRTVKILQDPKTKTFADFLRQRPDCIKPDQNGKYGTNESVELSIKEAKREINRTKFWLKKHGIVPPSWDLETRDRRTKKEKSRAKQLQKNIEKLKAVGFKFKKVK